MTEHHLPNRGGGIPAAQVVRNHWLLQAVEKAGTAAVNRLPLRLRPHVLRATRRNRPPRKIAATMAVSQQTIDGVHITWLGRQRSCTTILYLHGGAFLAGPISLHWQLLATIHQRTGSAAGMLLYRRPPQDPHPAALNDTLTAIQALHANGELTDGHWVLAGDSAGGTLALAATQHLRDNGGPLPAGLMLTAPMVDMELAHPDTVAAIDAAGHKRDDKFWWAFELYANGLAFNEPTLSPINASVAGLPPVHLNVGTEDFFLHDVRRFRDALQANHVPVTYIEQEHADHVYALRGNTPQARWVIDDQIRWLEATLPSMHTDCSGSCEARQRE